MEYNVENNKINKNELVEKGKLLDFLVDANNFAYVPLIDLMNLTYNKDIEKDKTVPHLGITLGGYEFYIAIVPKDKKFELPELGELETQRLKNGVISTFHIYINQLFNLILKYKYEINTELSCDKENITYYFDENLQKRIGYLYIKK